MAPSTAIAHCEPTLWMLFLYNKSKIEQYGRMYLIQLLKWTSATAKIQTSDPLGDWNFEFSSVDATIWLTRKILMQGKGRRNCKKTK